MKKKKSSEKTHAKFSEREDDTLTQLVEEYGEDNWEIIAEQMKGRNKRQCKERWMNYLCPSINMDPWSEKEDALLQEKYHEYGPRWVTISKFFKNRTDTMVKNRFQLLKRRRSRSERLDLRRAERAKRNEQTDKQEPDSTPPPATEPIDSFDWSKIDNDAFGNPLSSFFGTIDDIFQ